MQQRKIRVLVYGVVQGVGFRYFTRQEAHRLHLSGRATNLNDGSVEVIASGDSRLVEQLIMWLHQGPPSAHVERIVIEDLNMDGTENHDFRAY